MSYQRPQKPHPIWLAANQSTISENGTPKSHAIPYFIARLLLSAASFAMVVPRAGTVAVELPLSNRFYLRCAQPADYISDSAPKRRESARFVAPRFAPEGKAL